MKIHRKNISLPLIMIFNFICIFLISYWVKLNISEKVLLQNFTHISKQVIILAFVCNVLGGIIYGLRMRAILNCGFFSAFSIVTIGNTINNLLPFRSGELARVFFAKKIFNMSAIKSSIAIIYERFIDLLALAFLGLTILPKIPANVRYYISWLALGLLFSVMIFGFLTVVSKKLKTILKNKYTENFFENLFSLVANKKISVIVTYTGLIWILTISTFYIFFAGSLSDLHFTIQDAIAILVVSALSTSFSTIPSNIGLFEAGIVFYLSASLGVEKNYALALALLFHLIVLVSQVCMCVVVLFCARKFVELPSFATDNKTTG